MKKIIITVIIFISTISTLSAQEIGSIVLSMPNNIIFGLEAAQKDKLIADPKDTTQIIVDRGTFSAIKRLKISSDFISLQTSAMGTTQIKLLPLINESKIICVVKTVCGKACDSQIEFYTTKWVPIPQKELFPETDKDWFIKPDTDKNTQCFKNAYAALDMNPMKFILSPDNTSLSVEYTIKDYLSDEDYKKIEPYLIEGNKIFEWNKTSYK